MGSEIQRKPNFLCLHGLRTSGKIMKAQVGKWPNSVLEKLDLVFIDAPFPAEGKSDVEGFFDPPYYEWFQFDQEFMEYRNLDKCLDFIEDYMLKFGPFDGLMGFSQGGILTGGLPGMQASGFALTKVPTVKYVIVIGGAEFRSPKIADLCYATKIKCPSLHFLGEHDILRQRGTILLESFVDPVVVHHPAGHTVPRLDEESLPVMNKFIKKLEETI